MHWLAIMLFTLCFSPETYTQTFHQEFKAYRNKEVTLGCDINIFVWNLYMQKYISVSKLLESGLSDLINQADILLFQEIIVDKNNLHHQLGFDQFNVFQVPYLKSKKDQFQPNKILNGFMTASKVETTHNELFIGDSKDLADGTQSMAIISTFPIKDKAQELMIIHVHNGVSFFRTMRMIKKLNKVIQDHEGPLIVAGDFNTFLFKKYFVKKWARKLKLNDSNVKTPFVFKNIKLGQLDHAFYKGLNLKNEVQVIEATKSLSDHIGYKLEFSKCQY